MIEGWYYLHENGELIYKKDPDAIEDIRDSDLCIAAWAWDGQRSTAWSVLVEALALDANKQKVEELAIKWKCDNEDAVNYAKYMGLDIGMDGDAFFARSLNAFVDLQQSPCGFGENYLAAFADFAKQIGYAGGKTWGATLRDKIFSL